MYNTISPFFDIQQDGLGQTFKEKYEAYKAIKEKYKPKEVKGANSTYQVWEPEGEDVANFKRICDEFMDAYAGVVRYRLKEYADAMFGREVNIKYVDYDDVMQNVMQRKFPANDFGSSIKAIKKVGEWLGKGTTKVIGEAMGGSVGAFIGSLFG